MRRQQGSTFVVTLAVLAGLVAVLASVAATHQTFVMQEANRIERDRARLTAEAGVQRALQVLYAQASQTGGTTTSTSTAASTSGAITQNDEWYTFGQKGAESFIVGNASFRVEIVDLASRVNLNTASQQQLERLPLTTEQIESILDFREPGQEIRPEGAKDQFYNGLAQPYNAKLRGFDTLDELLQVRGFTPQVLYEPQTEVVNSTTAVQGSTEEQPALADVATVFSFSPETTPTGEAKINLNAGEQAQKLQRLVQAGIPQPIAQQISARNWPTLGQVFTGVPGLTQDMQRILLDNATTTAEPRRPGRINLNTVSEFVLNSIPGLTPDVVQSILQRQTEGFTSLGELLAIPGFTGEALQQVDLFSASSQTFLIRVIGKSGGAQVALEAIVDIQEGTPKVVQMQEPPYNDFITRWLWNEEASETSLKEAE
jgi:general secretion pathway protein K